MALEDAIKEAIEYGKRGEGALYQCKGTNRIGIIVIPIKLKKSIMY